MRLGAILLAAALPVAAQQFSHRGFLETRGTFYVQRAPGDSGLAWGEALLRWEPRLTLGRGFTVNAAFDARTDTHRMTERQARFDWRDRSRQRPALSLRRASLGWRGGPASIEVGKQFIRWGKADILNPTDRFAPRDYLSVADSDFLGVTAARLTLEHRNNSLDLVSVPWFTPSRTPLLNQRWVVQPPELSAFRIADGGARLPGRAQFGARWNRTARGYEHSFVFYEGFHHLPLLDGRLIPPGRLSLQRYHPKLRLWGGDVAVPTPWVTLKAEAAWFTSATPTADEYALWVAQAERTVGEWVFVGGYAGEAVTKRRNPIGFAPDRGFARSLLARASYTIDARRGLAVEAAIRQDGAGSLLKGEYSEQWGAHWRITAGFTWIRGRDADFLGQYRRNSNALLTIRYSF